MLLFNVYLVLVHISICLMQVDNHRFLYQDLLGITILLDYSDRNALLNTCGYPEEEIRHSTEKRNEEKEANYLPKVQEGKEEIMHTREQGGKEEIIYTKEEKAQTN